MLTFMCTCIMQLMLNHVRVGGDVNLHVHLRHEVAGTSRQGWGWGGWGDVNLHVHLRHEVDGTSLQLMYR